MTREPATARSITLHRKLGGKPFGVFIPGRKTEDRPGPYPVLVACLRGDLHAALKATRALQRLNEARAELAVAVAKPQRLSLGLRRCVRSMREHLALALLHDGAKVAWG